MICESKCANSNEIRIVRFCTDYLCKVALYVTKAFGADNPDWPNSPENPITVRESATE